MGYLKLVALLLLAASTTVKCNHADLSHYALTDTGAINGGHNFPGVVRPYGIVKLGPDVDNGKENAYCGYLPDGNITGFSMLHESGIGGAPKYGVVSQMPIVGTIDNPLSDSLVDTRAKPDFTEVGYYRSSLRSGIEIELAASSKAGMYRYTFPDSNRDRNVLVDVSHVLPYYGDQKLDQHFLGGSISIHQDKETGHSTYTGSGTYDGGWNHADLWTVYFCGKFDAPLTFKTFVSVENGVLEEFSSKKHSINSTHASHLGAVFTFNQTTVVSNVGISFISADQACSNMEHEAPEGITIHGLRQETRSSWNAQVFSKFSTSEKNITKLNQLYTSLYFMHLMPTNKTGENPLWESQEPYYDDIFTFWDIFRCTTALFHILQPSYYEEFLRSMIDTGRHQGWVSDARSSFYNGAVQGGSNGDNVFADAYIKGVRGKINWEDAFASMKKNAEVVPSNNNDQRDPTGSTKEGRGALPDWLQHGFITTKFSRSVSRAVEYSVNDFSLATVAAGLGHDSDFARYFNRSRNWRNQWNPDMQALGFSGFLGPRTVEGFIKQDPLSCGGCYWKDYYYEALPWEYSFNAHHDLEHLKQLCGGNDTFVKRLEMTFKPGVNPTNTAFNGTIFDPGNEPSFTTPYLYNFVNRQDLSVKHSRSIAKSYYSPTPGGLPGNSDAGSMESWLLWNMIGLYPLTGQTTFLIGSPWFPDLTIALGSGKTLKIMTQGGSEDRFYVQSLKVNGKKWNKSWLSWHDVFADGGALDFVLGPEPKQWATGETPPSPASLHAGDAKELIKAMSQGRAV